MYVLIGFVCFFEVWVGNTIHDLLGSFTALRGRCSEPRGCRGGREASGEVLCEPRRGVAHALPKESRCSAIMEIGLAKQYMVRLLGPNSIIVLYLDPLGSNQPKVAK